MPASSVDIHRNFAQTKSNIHIVFLGPFHAQTMLSWCFLSQKTPLNRNLNPHLHTQSDRDHTDTEPPEIRLLTPPWNQVQKSVAARISGPVGDPASCQTSFEIIRITGAGPPYEGQLSQLKHAGITCLGVSSDGTTSRVLSYERVQSSSGGPEALAEFVHSCPARSRPHLHVTEGSTGELFSYNSTRPLSSEPGRPPVTTPPLLPESHSMQTRWLAWSLMAPILASLTRCRHWFTKD
ncbi:hypothetical protein BDW74DRAFT_163589 [Aspergillus multicolor]|uniref:uncharacterized protein n=1 Tax=Aspergillus multicolor TaxID=41759 RepID=UPI003CCD560D